MEPRSRKPGEPRARPPDAPSQSETSGNPAPNKGQTTPDSEHKPDNFQQILGCLSSHQRLSVLASLAHGPRSVQAICRILQMGTAEVDEYLRPLIACGLVTLDEAEQEFSLTDLVEMQEVQGDLHILVRTSEGARVQGHLSMSTPTGRLLARGWIG